MNHDESHMSSSALRSAWTSDQEWKTLANRVWGPNKRRRLSARLEVPDAGFKERGRRRGGDLDLNGLRAADLLRRCWCARAETGVF